MSEAWTTWIAFLRTTRHLRWSNTGSVVRLRLQFTVSQQPSRMLIELLPIVRFISDLDQLRLWHRCYKNADGKPSHERSAATHFLLCAYVSIHWLGDSPVFTKSAQTKQFEWYVFIQEGSGMLLETISILTLDTMAKLQTERWPSRESPPRSDYERIHVLRYSDAKELRLAERWSDRILRRREEVDEQLEWQW